MVERDRVLECLAQARLARVVPARVLIDLDAGLGRERPKRVRERDAVPLHDEAEDVPAQPATKAFPGLARWCHDERRGLLAVKGTQPLERGAGLPELNRLADDVSDAELVLDLGRDACCRDGPPRSCLARPPGSASRAEFRTWLRACQVLTRHVGPKSTT